MVGITFGAMAFDAVRDGGNGLMTAVLNGRYTITVIPDPALGPRKIEVEAMYDTQRYRPKYSEKVGVPVFMMCAIKPKARWLDRSTILAIA